MEGGSAHLQQTRLPTDSELAGTERQLLLLVLQNQVLLSSNQIELGGRIDALMTDTQNLRGDITQVKADVAANQAAALAEIQQVLDALARASANATELADLKAAVNDAHTQLQGVHTTLSETNAALIADDPAATPPRA